MNLDPDLVRLYDELAESEADWNPFEDPDHRERASTIVRWSVRSLPPEGRLLDVGCGDGHIAARIARCRPDARVVGVDISRVRIERARSRYGDLPNVGFEVADARALPFDESTFDVVVCAEVLEHVPEWRRAARELVRVCRPGGRLIVSVPDDREPDGTYHLHRLTPERVERALRSVVPRVRVIGVREVERGDTRIPRVWVVAFEL